MKNNLRAKLSSRALSMLVIITLMSFGVGAAFADEPGQNVTPPPPLVGSGTLEDPFQLDTCEELQRINDNQNADYILTGNIDCVDAGTFNDGAGFAMINGFYGHYIDGRNYTISNLSITDDTSSLGFINEIGTNSTVKNIVFTNVTITNSNTNNPGDSIVGGLAGINKGSVDNVHFNTSTIVSPGTVGGISGSNEGSISRSSTEIAYAQSNDNYYVFGGLSGYSTGDISESTSRSDISFASNNYAFCGGLVGWLNNGSIEDSYYNSQMECTTTDQSGTKDKVGGLVGLVEGSSTITNSFARATANHSNIAGGGIVGDNSSSIDLSTNYFDADMAGITNCDQSGNTSCGIISGDENYFFNGSAVAPMGSWNWDATWIPAEGATPQLTPARTLAPLAPVVASNNITETNFSMSWNEPAASTVDGYEVIYVEDNQGDTATMDGEVQWESYTTLDVNTRSFTANNDLDPNKRYDFRVRAYNSVGGSGTPSYPQRVRAIPAALDTPTATNSLSRAISISWNNNSSNSDSYVVEYKKTSSSDWTTYTRTNYPTPSSDVYPLDESTSYDFRVSSVNERGTGPFSESFSASTVTQQSYEVSSCQDLQDINNDPFGNYTLTGDIDCTESATWNDGQGFEPIGGFPVMDGFGQGVPFSGQLHGANHKITNLVMDRPGTPSGLFMSIDGATIDNLTFEGGQVSGSRADDGTVYTDVVINPVVGTLAALAANSAITNVHSDIDLRSNGVEGLNGGAGGLIGLVMPSVFGPGTDVTTMTITDSSTSGEVDGMVTGGLVGGSILVDIISIIGGGANDYGDVIPHIGTGVDLTVSNSQTSGKIDCIVVCGGFVGISIGGLTLENVTRTGETGSIGASNPPTGPQLDDILAMILLSGPVSGGLVGGSIPLSLSAEAVSLEISDSTVSGSVTGTAASGIVGIGLPAISFDLGVLPSEGEELSTMQLVGAILSAVGRLLTTDALIVDNVDISADIVCTVACGGVTALSLGKTLISQVAMTGDLTNDNTPLIEAGHPISYCPIQITGGLVGTQLLFPLAISDSSATGDIEVIQGGDAPDTKLIDLLSADFNDDSFLIELFCSLGSNIQGTGGILGTFVSPLDVTGIAASLLGLPSGTFPALALSISNTSTTGDVVSNAYSATGGLAGFIFGKSNLTNTFATGDVMNSTFAEMFRTPISSAATGGLVGRMLGGYQASGNILAVVDFFMNSQDVPTGEVDGNGNPIVEFNAQGMFDAFSQIDVTSGYSEIFSSHASGNVTSSNSAGGLVGNVAGITKIKKSYATGNVSGTAAGGLIGSGFNMGSLLGVANIFSTIELDNTYARGNIVTSDDPDTVTFAGGLVGMMAHFGSFSINNSYSTGSISVNNNATDTRLVAGGLVGAELDMSVLPKGLTLAFADEPILQYVLGNLNALGLDITSGVSVTNSFTTSSVPAKTAGKDALFTEIATGNPSSYKTTGSVFGFFFSLDTDNFPTFPTPAEGEDLEMEDILNFVNQIQWQGTDDIVSNTQYDRSANPTNTCGSTSPALSSYFESIYAAAANNDPENPTTPEEIMQLLPGLVADAGNTCTPVNADGKSATYFKNNTTVAPLKNWNFNGVWFAHGKDFPTFTNDPTDPVNPECIICDPGPDNPGPDDPFIPRSLPGEKDIQTITSSIADLAPNQTLAQVLDNVIKKVDGGISGKAAKEIRKDKSDSTTKYLAFFILLMLLIGSVAFYETKIKGKRRKEQGKEKVLSQLTKW